MTLYKLSSGRVFDDATGLQRDIISCARVDDLAAMKAWRDSLPEFPAPEPVRHWVTSPVIGETIEVATKADFSDAWTVRVERLRGDGFIPNSGGFCNPRDHHTRRPAPAKAWYEELVPGERIGTAHDRRVGVFVSHDKRRPCIWWREDGASLDTWASPSYFAPLPPVDRRTLPCFENCVAGDTVDVHIDGGWRCAIVRKQPYQDGRDWCVPVGWVGCGGNRAIYSKNEIRWPQSDVAPYFMDAPTPCDSCHKPSTIRFGVLDFCGACARNRDAAMIRESDEFRATIAAKDADLTSQGHVIAEHVMNLSRANQTIAAKDADVSHYRSIVERWEGEHAKEISTLRAQLATAEKDLREANEMAECVQARRALLRVLGALDLKESTTTYEEDAANILAAIASLKSESRLVLPAEVLAHHPLPWRRDGMVIYSGHTKVISTCTPTGSYGYDVSIAAAIVEAVNAANRAVKS
jgi:hypothetical protein